jgi:hypothetical protein
MMGLEIFYNFERKHTINMCLHVFETRRSLQGEVVIVVVKKRGARCQFQTAKAVKLGLGGGVILPPELLGLQSIKVRQGGRAKDAFHALSPRFPALPTFASRNSKTPSIQAAA